MFSDADARSTEMEQKSRCPAGCFKWWVQRLGSSSSSGNVAVSFPTLVEAMDNEQEQSPFVRVLILLIMLSFMDLNAGQLTRWIYDVRWIDTVDQWCLGRILDIHWHEWMRMHMLARPSSNLLQRIGSDYWGGRAQLG